MWPWMLVISTRRRGGCSAAPASTAVQEALGDLVLNFTRQHIVDREGAPLSLTPWQEHLIRVRYGAASTPAG